MKWMIASDIHGSAYYCQKMIGRFKAEGADRLLLLGDILYHGPRNDLPRDYNPKQVIAMLSPLKNRVLCVRGNCDTEVDQMVLPFPILADYGIIDLGGRLVYATHGHRYNPTTPPPLCPGDILLFGHTHVPTFNSEGDFCYANPGSVSIPKENSPHSYAILQGDTLAFKDIQTGDTYMTHNL